MIIATMMAAFLPIDLYRYAVMIINGMNLISSSPSNWITAHIINTGEPFIALSVKLAIPNALPIVFAIIATTSMSVKPIITTIMSLGFGILKIFDMSSLNTYNTANNGGKVMSIALNNPLPVECIKYGIAEAIKKPIIRITTFLPVNLGSSLRSGKSYSLSSNLKKSVVIFNT